TDARGGDTHFGDPWVDLVRWELAALTRLCALGHLDLDIRAVVEVVAGHAETSRCHLLDSRAAGVAVGLHLKTLRVLTTLTGIGHALQAVHGNSQGFMRLGGDRAIRHGTGAK